MSVWGLEFLGQTKKSDFVFNFKIFLLFCRLPGAGQ